MVTLKDGEILDNWGTVLEQRRLWAKPGPSLGEVRLGSTTERGCYVQRAFVPAYAHALASRAR